MHVIQTDSNGSSRSNFSLYIGIVLIGANLRAPITCLGPVLPDIEQALHLGGSGAGVLNAIPLIIFAFLSLVAPGVGHRHGLKRVIAGAIVAILLGTVMRSLPLPGAIWAGTLLLSAGIAFGNVLLPGLVKREFPDHAARLIGFYAAAMATAAGVAAGLAVPIAQLRGSNWRWSIGCWSVLALITLVAWIPQLSKQTRQAAPSPSPASRHISPWRHRVGWQVSIFFSLHSFVFYSVVDWYASYATASGIAAGDAGFHLLIYQIVAVATNLGTASMIKRSDNQVLLGLACGGFLLLGCSGLYYAPQYALLWLICAGLGAGIAMVMSLSLFALRTRDHHQAAALSGMSQFVGYAGAAVGPLLLGVVHELTGAWRWPFALLILCSMLLMVFASLAGRQRYIDQ